MLVYYLETDLPISAGLNTIRLVRDAKRGRGKHVLHKVFY